MRKAVMIFLDGGTWTVIDQLLKSGDLPNFKKLISNGCRGDTISTVPPLTDYAFPTILTGRSAGYHGIYAFYEKIKESLKFNSRYDDSETKFLWDFLSEKGLKSIFFDVPTTYPPKELNGIMIPYSPLSLKPSFTYPASYSEKILKLFPDYMPAIRYRSGSDKASRKKFFSEICKFADSRLKMTDYLLSNEEWDFFMMDIMIADSVQHWFWKDMDKNHPFHKRNFASGYVREVYMKVDKFLGMLMAKLPKDALVILASDHGFGEYIEDVNVNKWLQDEGYLVFKKDTGILKKIAEKLGITPSNVSRLILNLRMGFLFKYIKRGTMYNVAHKFSRSYANIDMSKTKAYSYGYCGSIYMNKALLGEDYGKVRDEIISKLKKIKDPLKKEPLLKEVWKKEDIYPGPKNKYLPDITLNMQDFSYGCSSDLAFKAGELFSKPITLKSGDHKMRGFFIISGEGVKKSSESVDVPLGDLLPTLLHAYGIDIPNDLEGKARVELFEEGFKL